MHSAVIINKNDECPKSRNVDISRPLPATKKVGRKEDAVVSRASVGSTWTAGQARTDHKSAHSDAGRLCTAHARQRVQQEAAAMSCPPRRAEQGWVMRVARCRSSLARSLAPPALAGTAWVEGRSMPMRVRACAAGTARRRDLLASRVQARYRHRPCDRRHAGLGGCERVEWRLARVATMIRGRLSDFS